MAISGILTYLLPKIPGADHNFFNALTGQQTKLVSKKRLTIDINQ
jgi:hypothetical protein